MTVTREPINFALEAAPNDRFDDDAVRVYRVVAFVGTGSSRRHKVVLTRDHDTERDAMAVLADKIKNAVAAPYLMVELVERLERLERPIKAQPIAAETELPRRRFGRSGTEAQP